jgi:hypothetical protein
MESPKKYAVITDTEYYGGDCQHPKGWSISVATTADEDGETICIGTLDECKIWLDEIYAGRIYLNHGEAGKSYRIAEIIDGDADYQSWLDSYISWSDCPAGDDYDVNTEWAETTTYNERGQLYIDHPAAPFGLIVDLSTEV